MTWALFEAIGPYQEGRQLQECLTLQHRNSWRQSWKCFVCPVWMYSGSAGSNQVELAECRIGSAPPPNRLQLVSQVSSPASQERSEGGLQPDGDASNGPTTTQAQQKKEKFESRFIHSFRNGWKENIKENVFRPLFWDCRLKSVSPG